jgi:ABC-type branched-subunit amino acid transport system substrate-binding protein
MAAHTRRLAILAALVGVLALVGAGCGSSAGAGVGSSTPGVTATSITFGTHQPLTGPAAPGYSEIAPASQAYFDYVNAHGGVFGRKIQLLIKNDAYNPAQTVDVVHQLVLQDNVFGIFEGLGTPTHTKVVGFLNASKVPDLFVASGCPCWDNGVSQPYTFGWEPNYTIEGKILGLYIRRHFPSARVGILYQDDDFGNGGLAGIEDELPAASLVAKEPYQSGVTSLATEVTAIKAARARVMVDFTVPIYTAIAQLSAYTLGYRPQLVVSNVGIDPVTLGGLLSSLSKGRTSGTALIDGAITDDYMPSYSDSSNPWIELFEKVRAEYDPTVVLDQNTEYGMASAYTVVQALRAAGRNLTRQGLVNAIEQDGATWTGPQLVPFRFSRDDHGGIGGVEIGQVRNGRIVLFGGPMMTDPSPTGPIVPDTVPQPSPPANGIPGS